MIQFRNLSGKEATLESLLKDYEVVNSKGQAAPLTELIKAHSEADSQGKTIDSTHPLTLPATLRKKKTQTILTSQLGLSEEANVGFSTLLGG